MNLKEVSIDTLVMDPNNARTHNARNQDAVRTSISEFGQVEVLVVQKGTNVVIGGNCRLQEMRRLGHKKVWIAEVDVDGTKAKRLALALNRTGELGQWDDKVLGRLLSELEAAEDLDGVGWSDSEMDRLMADSEGDWLSGLGPEDSQIENDSSLQSAADELDAPSGEPKAFKQFQFGRINCMIPIEIYETVRTFISHEKSEGDSMEEALIALLQRGME